MKPLSMNRLRKLFLDLPKIQCVGTFFCRYDEIKALGKMVLMQSKKFPNAPLYSVPSYGIPRLFARGNPYSLDAQAVLHENDRKMRRMDPFA